MYILDQFLKYVKIDTAADPGSLSVPSTPGQLAFAELLVRDLREIGVSDAELGDGGVVYGSIPATKGCEQLPPIGFIAHMDTSPDCSGKDVCPRVIENYDGGDIAYPNYSRPLSPADFPGLPKHKGQTLIVTDGSTLLGADDKAGIAEIEDAVRRALSENIPHGTIALAFTPDEEIGLGVEHFDIPRFGADYAYTVDGGEVKHIEFECFNAASMTVTVTGFNIHPGSAKGKMKNAALIAFEFEQLLPAGQKPQYTERYEGFFHLSEINATAEKATVRYILRDHSGKELEQKKRAAREAAEFLNKKYGDGTVSLDIKDTYRNMLEVMENRMDIVDRATEAMRRAGISPHRSAIRGGTDGAALCFMGLPCPNLPTGGHNAHGRFEYIALEDMQKVSEIIVNIMRA